MVLMVSACGVDLPRPAKLFSIHENKAISPNFL